MECWTYGDAASLSPSACARLLQALGRLSETDPWFRHGNWQAPPIAALSRPDMMNAFQTVLRSPTAGFGVRSIVVEALASGMPLPPMKDDVAAVLIRQQSPFTERLFALRALLRLVSGGEAAIHAAYGMLGADDNGIRLRAEIIGKLYGRPFGAPEVAQLLRDTWNGTGQTTSYVLHTLANEVPIADVPAILDSLDPVTSREGVDRRGAWDVAAFYENILTRAWESDVPYEADRILQWMEVRRSMRGMYTGDRGERLRAAMRARQQRLRAMVDRFLETLAPDDFSWLKLTRFREATLLELSTDDLLDALMRHMGAARVGSAQGDVLLRGRVGPLPPGKRGAQGDRPSTSCTMPRRRDRSLRNPARVQCVAVCRPVTFVPVRKRQKLTTMRRWTGCAESLRPTPKTFAPDAISLAAWAGPL